MLLYQESKAFYEILEKEDAKKRTIEETNKREIEKLPEAYAEAVIIEATLVMPVEVVVATLVIPVAVVEATLVIETIRENTDFSQFEY